MQKKSFFLPERIMRNALYMREISVNEAKGAKMETIFLQKPTEKLSLNDGQLIVSEPGECQKEYPLAGMEQVLVYGNSQITTQALKACLQEGVRVVYFNSYGKFLGRLESSYPRNTKRRIQQYKLYLDPVRRLQWCRELLHTKIQGELIELRRLRENGNAFPCKQLRKELKNCQKLLTKTDSLPELLGIEGRSASQYYCSFSRIIPARYHWKGRQKHPAPDPANAVLSFFYGCAANRIFSECEKHSLDPYCGFLHEPGYPGGGIVYDLLETLRATLCDHCALYVLQNKKISSAASDTDSFHFSAEERIELVRTFDRFFTRTMSRQQSSPQDQLVRLLNLTVSGLASGSGEYSVPAYRTILGIR